MPDIEKIVVVTKKTALEELIERFNTRDQARFYIEHLGGAFAEYEQSHDIYHSALSVVKAALPGGTRAQWIERSFLPNFVFGDHDLVVTVGPDGLVVNTAKYLTAQPLLAINPDPQRIDGVLVPFSVAQCGAAMTQAVRGRARQKLVTMARAALNDSQTLYAVNDLFIGQATHVSARYRLRYDKIAEDQSSSGIIVSTGAGSTGWLRSVVTGASKVARALEKKRDEEQDDTIAIDECRFDAAEEQLYFSVREPFVSKVSGAQLVFGRIQKGRTLEITSHMPQNGVVFSDGIEQDYLEFNSGAIARITVAEKKVHLITAF